MTMTNYFPTSYEDSRERFRRGLSLLRSKWPDARLESHPLNTYPDLSIDWIWAEPAMKENIILLTTALHGVEGFVGSAMQYLFMQEYLPRLDPENTGLLLVHAINPWGMKHRERYNPNNVDLNRNFIPDGKYDPTLNPLYPELRNLLAPQYRINSIFGETLRFAFKVIALMAKHGVKAGRDGILMGQYSDPDGFYYGGNKREEETSVMMDLFQIVMRDYQTILHFDMHSGYGPRYEMSISNPSNDPLSSAEFAARYNYPLVVKANPDEFFTTLGDISAYTYHLQETEFPEKTVLATCFEFGTFGESLLAGIRSLRAEIMHKQLLNHDAKNEKIARTIRKEFEQLFFPAEVRWREKALADGRQAFEGILRAYHLLTSVNHES
jgi:predicted deacylase